MRRRPLWGKTVGVAILLWALASQLSSPAAQFQLGIRIGGTSVVSILGTTGTVCQLQWSDDLADPGRWLHLGHCVLTNGTSEFSDSKTNASGRYYRVVQTPDTNTVLIPAGSFVMGSTLSEANYDEKPAHSLYVSAFYMDRYEVTQSLWDAVFAWATNHGYEFDNPGSGKAANHPVHSVNWHDAVKWCNARSEMGGFSPCYYADTNVTIIYRTGRTSAPPVVWSATGYRLPTEAEWEKAARGGATGRRFPWSDSDTITHSRANYYSLVPPGFFYDLSPTRRWHPDYDNEPKPYTAPVGSFSANDYGLYDMAGNVAEWCSDGYDENWYSRPEATQANSHGPDSEAARVLRGGNWALDAHYARCADRRTDGDPALANDSIGFRCVRRP